MARYASVRRRYTWSLGFGSLRRGHERAWRPTRVNAHHARTHAFADMRSSRIAGLQESSSQADGPCFAPPIEAPFVGRRTRDWSSSVDGGCNDQMG
jgi:hypothetical protein